VFGDKEYGKPFPAYERLKKDFGVGSPVIEDEGALYDRFDTDKAKFDTYVKIRRYANSHNVPGHLLLEYLTDLIPILNRSLVIPEFGSTDREKL